MNEFRLDPESLTFTLITKKTEGCKACKGKETEISSKALANGAVRAYEIKDDVQPSKYELNGEFYKSSNADGYEEIIADSEKHEDLFKKYSVEETEKLLRTLVERVKELQPERENQAEPYKLGKNIVITRSQHEHGYFDLVMLQIPKKETKTCFECESVKNTGNREIYKTENFVVYVPFAPKIGFEVVIAPKNHISFKDIDSVVLFDLAAIIRKVLAITDKKLTWSIIQSDHGHFKVKIFGNEMDAYDILGINRVEASPDLLAKELRDSKKI